MNKIRQENAKPGTLDWALTSRCTTAYEIEGFAVPNSVSAGDQLAVYVSTQAPAFTAQVYRLGYYGGTGGRLMLDLGQFPGGVQPPPAATGRDDLSCMWNQSFPIVIPDDWVTGCYVIKLTAKGGATSDGKQCYATFVVRSAYDEPIDFVVHRATATDAAYNARLGPNMYSMAQGRPVACTFDRPDELADGAGRLLFHEYPMIRWLEREGFSLAYVSSLDLHQSATHLSKAVAFLSIGHDEYWTYEMRANVEEAVERGLSVGFFGANACYWQVRLEDSPLGPGRVLVCHKAIWGFSTDPEVPPNSEYTTTTWRDPMLGRPEQNLMGVMYVNWNSHPSADFVTVNTSMWPYKGTGSVDGQKISKMVGYEVDRVFTNGEKWVDTYPPQPYTIGNLVPFEQVLVLGDSPFEGTVANFDPNQPVKSNAALSIRPNLSRAFGAGTVDWPQGLADVPPDDNHQTIIKLTRNILHNFKVGPLAIMAATTTGMQKVYAEQWAAPSEVPPWRPTAGRAFAGNFLKSSNHATIALLSNAGASKRRMAFLRNQRAVAAVLCQTRDAGNLLTGWHDPGNIVLTGDFLSRQHDQFLFINNVSTLPGVGRVLIVDYFKGTADQAYNEASGASTLLNGWTKPGDIALAGDFMAAGHSQVLFINQDGQLGRLTIIDYSSGTPAESYIERWGDSTLLDGWHDPVNVIRVGDFLGRGHDQILFMDQRGTSRAVSRSTILDYSTGTAQQLYLEAAGASSWFNGWNTPDDVIVAGDFLNLGYSQLLLISNHWGANVPRAAVIDFKSGTPQQTVLENWGADSDLNGWSLADVVLVGKFGAGGGAQVAFLPT